MNPNQSTAKGFFASLGALAAVLCGFFFLMFSGQSDLSLDLAGLEDRMPRSAEATSPSAASAPQGTVRGSDSTAGQGATMAGMPTGSEASGGSFEGGYDRSVTVSPNSQVQGDLPQQPPVDDPHVQKAIELVDQGKVPEAIKLLEDVLARDPKNEQALVEMAMINLLDLKQPDAALGFMQRVVEINPTNQIVLNEMVSLYQEQGRVDDGLNYLMDLAEKKPGSSDLSYSIGQMMTLSGREQDAIPYMEKATQSPVHQTRAFRDLAETYSHIGNPDKSLEFYDKAIASQEREITERTNAGTPVTYAAERLAYIKTDKVRVFLQKGDLDAAQSLLNEVRAQMPSDPNVAQLDETIRKKRAG